MQKKNNVNLFLCIAAMFFLVLIPTVCEADKVVVIPLGSKQAGSESWTDGVGKVTTADDVGIGVTTPVAKMDVNGGIKIANDGSACNASKAGLIRWTGKIFEVCDGSDWYLLAGVPTVGSSGQTWMDRNLGAERVARNSSDSKSYGDLYQWGRPADGHESRNSQTVGIQSDENVPRHGFFIVWLGDWRSLPNDDLWQESGINNPCPTGFRLPTEDEWNAEMQSWSSQDAVGAFASPLKLVAAGYRNESDGMVGGLTNRNGYYWSSTVDGGKTRSFDFDDRSAYMFSDNRAFSFSVRCIKEY